jgi:RNA polymerase sigma-70 factor (ECF subfamily)
VASASTHPPEGSDGEFDDLLSRYQSQLFGYIYSLVRDLDDAEDLFQQTAVIIWKKFADYDPQRSFLAWSCGIARLEVMNFLRMRYRSRLYFTDELNLSLIDAHVEVDAGEFADRRDALRGCMQKLRDRDRALLTACYGVARGVAAAAQASGRSSQSVHNSLRRIRRALFECIQRTLNQETHPEIA